MITSFQPTPEQPTQTPTPTPEQQLEAVVAEALSEMEREASNFGGTRTWVIGPNRVQAKSVVPKDGRSTCVESWFINGWQKPKAAVEDVIRRHLTGNAEFVPAIAQTYAQMLEDRLAGFGKKISAVSVTQVTEQREHTK